MKRVFGSGPDPFSPLPQNSRIIVSLSRWLLHFCRTKSSLEIAGLNVNSFGRERTSWSMVRGANGDICPSRFGRSDNGERASEALLIDGLPPSPRLRDSPRIRTKGDLLTKNARPAARATPGQNYSPRVGGDREVARTCGNAQPQSKPRTVHCTV